MSIKRYKRGILSPTRWKAYHRHKYWREYSLVLLRANNACEKCGTTEDLLFHHKDGRGFTFAKKNGVGFDSIDNSENNIVLLCRACHAVEHGFNTSSDRLPVILELRQQGQTFAEIGEVFGISRQAVEQLYNKYLKKSTS